MENTGQNSYQTNCKVTTQPADALAVFCSDFRIQDGIRKFLNEGLNLKDKYDLLVIPGGPQALAPVDYQPKYSWSSWKWLRFLVEAHKLKRVILIPHQDCMWYGTLPAHLHSSTELRARQAEDIERVKKVLTQDYSHLSIETYYAGFDPENQVTLETIR